MHSFAACTPLTTFAEVLRYRSHNSPDQPAYRFLVDGEKEEVGWTYAELDLASSSVAARLLEDNLEGERVLMLYPPGLSFVSALFGCFYAGVTAVPCDLPRPRRPITRLESIVADARPAAILTTSELLSELRDRFDDHPTLAEIPLLATDTLARPAAFDWQAPEISPEQLAFIQYTSGSTATPKGVMLSHGNLLANSAQISQAFKHSPDSIGVIWLPAYHDMGLIGGILQPLYGGFPTVLMSPIHVVQQPLRWLNAISRFRATTSGGPNFMYDRCLDSISDEQLSGLDLSCWEVAFNGAEPVKPRTLERFAEKFAACGFHRQAFFPCYGLAEATLLVSGGPQSAEPVVRGFEPSSIENNMPVQAEGEEASLKLAGSGIASTGVEIRIVDPHSLKECSRGMIGEVWVHGPQVAMGYWNQPERTAETFRATLSDDRCYLRTGDLGFWSGDQLFITGRCKDLIIVDGRNHYPQDLELTAEQSHPALAGQGGTAFAFKTDGSEGVAIVHEVQRNGRGFDFNEIIRAVRQAVSGDHELAVSRIVLVKMGEIPRTSSGKVRRFRCRELLLSGELAQLAEWGSDLGTPASKTISACAESHPESSPRAKEGSLLPQSGMMHSRESIQNWLLAELSKRAPDPSQRIDIHTPFAAYGLTSRDAVEISGLLETELGQRLSPTLIYEFPTVELLSRKLGAATEFQAGKERTVSGRIERNEPIAIVGLGCRLPGAKNPGEFWQMLVEGRDAIREVPGDRWNPFTTKYRALIEGHDPEGTCLRWGGFLDEIDAFDAKFFGISPRDAMYIDPQQRLMLEVAWEALEDAGHSLEQLRGSQTGVFVGISTNDYGQLCLQQAELEPYWSTGNASCIAANRLSYFLDLKGPSIAVDTACSSSLVATHLACNSLRNGECDVALAGGVNVILTPAVSTSFAQAGGLAPDGRCKAFDSRANGIVRSEGAGVVVLKRLSQAIEDGDQIYAVIKGSAVNQDGRSNGITAPLQSSQEAVLQEAYRNAGVTPADIQYIEAHGAGSLLGDVIEAGALKNVLSQNRDPEKKCAIGSVKTNIGHLEAAAGVAGLIKLSLAFKHGELPANLHFIEPNPKIPFDEMPFTVQAQRSLWTTEHGRRLAGISGFGFGGTNAHLVLESAPVPNQLASVDSLDGQEQSAQSPANDSENGQSPSAIPATAFLLPLSAATPEALQLRAGQLAAELDRDPTSRPGFTDLCHTAALRRSHLNARTAIAFSHRDELLERLRFVERGENSIDAPTGMVPPGQLSKLTFVFSGHGGQWWGMGRQLYEQSPVFRSSIAACDELLSLMATWSIRDELLAEESQSQLAGGNLAALEINQVTQFAVQVALANVWLSWGITPDAVVGHSFGEAAAACVSGALDLADALRVVVVRSRLLSDAAREAPADSGMAAVRVSAADAAEFLEGYEEHVAISAYNSPKYTVLSGKISVLEELILKLKQKKIGGKLMPVPGAGHTPALEPIRGELEDLLADLRPRQSNIAFYSTVTGGLVDGNNLTAKYWGQNLVQKVNFAPAIEVLSEEGCDTFVEVGPASLLVAAVNQCLDHHNRTGVAHPSLRPKSDDFGMLFRTLGALYATGRPVAWKNIYPKSTQWVSLPGYPWQHESFWLDSHSEVASLTTMTPRGMQSHSGHPVLGAGMPLAHPPGSLIWQSGLVINSLPFLSDYRIEEDAHFPAAVALETALSAASTALGTQSFILEDVSFPAALQSADPTTLSLQASWAANGEDDGYYQLHSRFEQKSPWRQELGCYIRRFSSDVTTAERSYAATRERCPNSWDPHTFFESLMATRYDVGPAFRALLEIHLGDDEACARLRLPEIAFDSGSNFVVHPVLLDACLQLATAARGDGTQWLSVPSHVEFIHVWESPTTDASLWAHVQLRKSGTPDQPDIADIIVYEEAGRPLLKIAGLAVARLKCADISAASQDPREWLYELEWRATPLPSPVKDATTGTWVLFADDSEFVATLRKMLSEHGQHCIVVNTGDEFRQRDAHHFEIQPLNGADFSRLFDEVKKLGLPPVRGVLALWGCSAAPQKTSSQSLIAAEDRLLIPTLNLIKGIGQTDFPASPRLWIVTTRAQISANANCNTVSVSLEQAPLWGLGRTLQREQPGWRCTLVDLTAHDSSEARFLCDELLSDDVEDQLALRDGVRYAARLVRPAPTHDCFLSSASLDTSRCVLESTDDIGQSLFLREAARQLPGPSEVEVEVVCAARGGLVAAGRIRSVGQDVTEFHIDDDVLVVTDAEVSSHVTTLATRVICRPLTQTEEAYVATLPSLILAIHAVERLGQIAANDRVLVLGASTTVGKAMLQIARRAASDILIPLSESRELSENLLDGVHCFEQSIPTLSDQILAATQGEGVDLLLDCRHDATETISPSCLKPYGRIVEMVMDNGCHSHSVSHPAHFSRFTVDPRGLFVHRPDYCFGLLRKAMALLELGTVTVLPFETLSICEIGSSERITNSCNLIFKMQDRAGAVVQAGDLDPQFSADATYLITGGLGGIGLFLADWMVNCGARHLVLMSRRTPDAKTESHLQSLRDKGASIHHAQVDLTNRDEVQHMFEHIAAELPPLRGLLHCASTLDDIALTLMTPQQLTSVMASKTHGAWNLHELTLGIPLDFFVMFSSGAALIGPPGSANYAAGNAFLDALAQFRHQQGLTALTVGWGLWGDAGMVTNTEQQARIKISGFRTMPARAGTRMLGRLMQSKVSHLAVMPVDWAQLRRAARATTSTPFLSDLFSQLAEEVEDNSEIRTKLLEADVEERRPMLLDYLRNRLAVTLGINPDKIPVNQPLAYMGVDSLMALELKNRCEAELRISIRIAALLEGPTLEVLTTALLTQVELSINEPDVNQNESAEDPLSATRVGVGKSAQAVLEKIDELDEQNLDALYKQMLEEEGAV